MSPSQVAAPELDGFTLDRTLGSGGFATVFLYRQHLPDREVAVKVLHEGVGERTASSFTAEANVMARLSAHPSIVTVYTAAIAPDGRPYLVMEYYPRPNLNVRSRAKPLPVDSALDVMVRIAGAVETAHRAGIIHRDIKPANILTSAYGKPGLTDFGISATKTDLTDRDSGLSIPWSAPEVVEGRSNGDERSDVYSLAATLYSLLSGRSPFERPGQRNSQVDLLARIGTEAPAALDRSDIPAGLQRVISMGLDPEPAHRPQSASAFARLLQAVEAQLHLVVTPLDVLGEDGHHEEDQVGDDGEVETRVRGATVVRPSAASGPSALIQGIPDRPRAVSQPPVVAPVAVPLAPTLVDTVQRGAAAQQHEPVAGAEAPTRSRGWLRVVAVAAVAAVLAGVGITALNADGTSLPTVQPTHDQDAVPTSVPTPKDLTIARTAPTAARATWTVDESEAQDADRYQWERFGPGSSGPKRGTVAQASATFSELAEDERLCLRVWLVRANGHRSAAPAENCED